MIGISKQRQKYIQSLHIKKYRQQYGAFLVEGRKSIEELLAVSAESKISFEIEHLFLTETAVQLLGATAEKAELCTEKDLAKVSFYKTNTFGLAVVRMPNPPALAFGKNTWLVAVDGIKDPGNLGTIVRTADWYGIKQVWCSEDTVDFYSPKVIASTMGSFTRIAVSYVDLSQELEKAGQPVYGAFLGGENVHSVKFPESGILLIGSESHGISPEISEKVNHRITIPQFGRAESLNAGIATAVLLDNLRRNP
ncbi:RNA methyltransferase [Marinilongibacter aquaticus]|uniref:TrmH family RNA methyltransferase n=1 Tax=Marinilongibacter aquaticus TaxID=2975157 RepID=UPI0021BD67C5|nr:RNA methyltransferase [Marinilongibacter aquaticus]UBM58597.1 RNA methyltransferase [Marinilongibacter aquaticus]